MKHIILTNGQATLVDDELYEQFNRYNWYLSGWGYVSRSTDFGTEYMHAVVLDLDPGEHGDHLDGNKLNNLKVNLRKATRSENQQGRGLQSNNTSEYRGVSWDKERQKWYAYINKKGKRRMLGRFELVEDAARAYDKAAIELFGENAAVNFPKPQMPGVI